MATGREAGLAPIPLILSALLGLLIAGIGSFAIVAAGTAKPADPVNKPLITYDSP
ncbi:MAG: hypothetical protein ABJA93_10780 [Sporichthyaceae bacterium]